jgi:hypothetical protein
MVYWQVVPLVFGLGSSMALASKVTVLLELHDWPTQHIVNADDNPIHATVILGYLMFSRGIGNILSTPISTALLSSNSQPANADVHSGFAVDNGKYKKMIVYVGTCFAGAAATSLIGWAGEKNRVWRSRQ